MDRKKVNILKFFGAGGGQSYVRSLAIFFGLVGVRDCGRVLMNQFGRQILGIPIDVVGSEPPAWPPESGDPAGRFTAS